MQFSTKCAIIYSSSKGEPEAVSTSDKKEVIFMRIELVILELLLQSGYINSFRVTKDKIFVTIKK